MRTKLNGILTLLLAFVVHLSFAQDKTISGVVTDSDGLPLPGVNIVVEGTSNGTQTDFDGNYSITASAGQSLLFTYIGQRDVRRTVGAGTTMNVQMEEDAQALEEVVVTAQGIKREKKALGYAVSSVGTEQLQDRAEGDVARVLAGKAAGVQITSAGGAAGSATNVVIRGLSSFSGSNQALFIVDGVPFSNDTNQQGSFIGGNTGSSRFLDLDPNNIESIEVLKGLSAATLYGTQGRNGVILVTTKSGSASTGPKKTEITVSQSFFSNEIASLPDYQQQYGNGFDQAFGWFFSNWGPSFDRGGTAGWGAQSAIDDAGTLAHPYSTASSATGIPQAFPEFAGARYEWRPYASVANFFQPGATINTNVNVSGSSEDGNTAFNANVGYYDDEGFTPGNEFNRFNMSIGGVAKLSNKFTIRGTMNYARSDVKTPPIASSRGNGTDGLSIYGNVFFTPLSVDLMGLPFENPIDGSSVYYRQNNSIINPRWTAQNVQYRQITNRSFWNLSATYEINDNLSATWRSGLDFYNERNINSSNKGGVRFNEAVFGFLQTYDNNNTIWDHFASINGNYDISEKLGLSFTAGATARSDFYDRSGVGSTGQLVFGVKRHFNFENQTPIQFSRKRNIVGLLGQATLDYDDFLFLNISARKDWVSNFQSENNNITYPGASLSFLPTNAFPELKSENGLNFLKLRASYGTSANFDTTAAYPTVGVTSQDTQVFNDGLSGTSITTNQVSGFKANPDLKPELLEEIELGIESKFWKNRISLDATYFIKTTNDLIVSEPLAPSTGFTLTQSNIGEIENKGWEAEIGVDIFRGENFNWNSKVNFFTNDVIVTELDQDAIFYAGSLAEGGGLFRGSNAAIKGESLGTIVGTQIQRDDAGNFVVNSAGSYNVAEQDADGNVPIIGDYIADYQMNFINSISYKNWNLNFQINHTKGGDVLSSTIATLLGRGLSVETEDRLGTYVLPGVREDGSVNNIQINNSTYFFSNLLFGPTETRIYDASVVRLQEVSLAYSVPSKFLDKTPFGALTFTLQGFNLWYDAYNTPDGANFDPNVQGVGIGNGGGFDFLNGPSARRYGFTVRASF
ncbi:MULTISPECIES: SusC/RagA family TonB-linked outer membrane protein [Croceitalea]|uniref:SusC/RagA family TonB-linked outer membrane protein n=1 Tax=Croceitalea vernalis TaxID=3075599 RepID=A0ABU3BJR2_9FLAO|nr:MULTISPECIES: SusC/RagA family TonB-linked outer membrane protein [unclassified Croceitalea]MDT0540544.1 SusC/RagA family TonB-linked outer membrane protein [Croceitalea sp. P059]MDT0622400.1 SusC/RagA family TonB-linked outer membrane protein [Croceitalea sp. P007]